MTVDITTINDALVFRDTAFPFRLYDAVGNGVVKHLDGFASWPHDDTTLDPTEWLATMKEAGAGETALVITDKAGGALLITTAGGENDGVNMQLGAAAGESIKLDDGQPLYCGISLALDAATQSDLFFGVGVTDTDWSGGITDGMYFSSVDGSAVVNFITEKNSVESSIAAGTLADDVDIVLEFYFDGTTVKAYVNGLEVASQAATAATFPNDEELRLTLELLTGATAVVVGTVNWIRMVHLR